MNEDFAFKSHSTYARINWPRWLQKLAAAVYCAGGDTVTEYA